MSEIPRLFVSLSIAQAVLVELLEGQHQYLTRVLRLKENDSVRLFNGHDGEWLGTIAKVSKKSTELQLERQIRPQTAITPVTLAFAPIKKSQTEWLIEKATELGVTTLQPIITEYSQNRPHNFERWRRIAVEAAEQSERLCLPTIKALLSLEDILKQWPDKKPIIYCDERGHDHTKIWGGEKGRAPPMLSVLAEMHEGEPIILIGPEGGFSPEERERIRALPNGYPVNLGPQILRAETAAITALATYQMAFLSRS